MTPPQILPERAFDQPTNLSPQLPTANEDDTITVVVLLTEPAGGEVRDDHVSERAAVATAQQARFIRTVAGAVPSAVVHAQVQLVLNAVFLSVDESELDVISALPGVDHVARVATYVPLGSDTVSYIGGRSVQVLGFDGAGVSVAVIDSGVDYYHIGLGGSGDPADYDADDPTTIEQGTFPTNKVVGGFDFVGEAWPFGPETPDPDPLDKGGFAAGHGTAVADIIGGINGVAPGVEIYALGVCSKVFPTCSGMAMVQAMEFAVDPNADGRTRDHVDIANVSIGSRYGQPFDHAMSHAVENAANLGVLTVAAAGNDGDHPYIVSTPAASPSALAVAQTFFHVDQLLDVDGSQIVGVHQDWSAPVSTMIGPAQIQFGDGVGGALDGCSTGPDPDAPNGFSPYPAGSLAGKIVLVDRGTCLFSTKIQNIEAGGGVAGLIGMVTPDPPFRGTFGLGIPPSIPAFMISQADSEGIKAAIAGGGGVGTIDPDNQLVLAGFMQDSSSRGPSNTYQAIKPEIGAPGTSVAASAGTGTSFGEFGGTSGAAPMVAGSAALLLDAFKTAHGPGGAGLEPEIAKALLMNTAEVGIATVPFSGPAEVSRVGSGEVRVDRAVDAHAVAYDADTGQGSLSFGMHEVHSLLSLTKTVRVEGLGDGRRPGVVTYDLIPAFRDPADEASGAVSITTDRDSIRVGEGGVATFRVTIVVDPSRLASNTMDSADAGDDPAPLTFHEFDGYIFLDDPTTPGLDLHLAWHVLPRKAARLTANGASLPGTPGPVSVPVVNEGAETAQIDSFSLVALSPDIPEGAAGAESPTPDIRAIGIATLPVPPGFCSADPSFVWGFAVATWEKQSHLKPVSHAVRLDIDQDGTADYEVFNATPFDTPGQELTYVLNLANGEFSVYFYAEHAMNTANTVLYICAEQVGMSVADLGLTHVDMSVESRDWYFLGPGDSVSGITVTPLGERYIGPLGSPSQDIPANSAGTIDVFDFGPFAGNTQEYGLMVLTNGYRGNDARGGATDDTELLIISAP